MDASQGRYSGWILEFRKGICLELRVQSYFRLRERYIGWIFSDVVGLKRMETVCGWLVDGRQASQGKQSLRQIFTNQRVFDMWVILYKQVYGEYMGRPQGIGVDLLLPSQRSLHDSTYIDPRMNFFFFFHI